MKALLLAAGLGTRLRPLTDRLPKCLMPINGRPLLEYWLDNLVRSGVEEVLINTHHHADMVSGWLRNRTQSKRVTSSYEEELLGTGGTIVRHRAFAGSDPIMVIHADNLCAANLTEFVRAHADRPNNVDLTMMTFMTSAPEACGIVEQDEQSIVHAFHEKISNPPGNLANGAVYIIEPSVVDFLTQLDKKYIDFSLDVLPHFLGRIQTYHNAIYHRDIGTPMSLLTAQHDFPETSPEPPPEDSWPDLCAGISDEWLNKMSVAFDARVIGVNELLSQKKIDQNIRKHLFIVDMKEQVDSISRVDSFVRLQQLDPEGIVLSFSRVKCGFSSAKIYSRYSLKSVVLCAQPTLPSREST